MNAFSDYLYDNLTHSFITGGLFLIVCMLAIFAGPRYFDLSYVEFADLINFGILVPLLLSGIPLLIAAGKSRRDNRALLCRIDRLEKKQDGIIRGLASGFHPNGHSTSECEVESKVAEPLRKFIESNRNEINSIPGKVEDLIDTKGSVYFTGIINKYLIDDLFQGISLGPPIQLDDNTNTSGNSSHRYSTTKILAIGLGLSSLPIDLLRQVRRDIASNSQSQAEYQVLITNNQTVTDARVLSRLDVSNVSGRDYRISNIDNFSSIIRYIVRNYDSSDQEGIVRRILNNETCLKIKEHDTYPFGLMLAHNEFIWYTPLWNHKSSKARGPLLEVVRASTVGSEVEMSFDEIWKKARSVSKAVKYSALNSLS